jgi:oligopeptide transport system permease protein
MATYFLRRILWLIPVLFTVALLTFVIMHAAPGGPWDRDLNARQVDAATQKVLNAHYGLDKPLWRQFIAYTFADVDSEGELVCGLICGNLGPSYRVRGRTVQDILFDAPKGESALQSKFGYSMRLGLIALTMAAIIGIPVGVFAALRQNSWVDYLTLFIATAGISLPSFVMGIFMIILFASTLHWISVIPRSWDDIRGWILPAAVLGFGTMAYVARLTRTSMLEVLRQDYIRTARAKGLNERLVVYRHMMRNALIPVVTILGPSLAALVTGSFIIETMFSFPGMGREYVQAISRRDYSMIMGTTLVYVLLVSVANLTVDFLYVFIDPRIRLED